MPGFLANSGLWSDFFTPRFSLKDRDQRENALSRTFLLHRWLVASPVVIGNQLRAKTPSSGAGTRGRPT